MTIRLVNRGLVLDTSTSTAIKDPKKIKESASIVSRLVSERMWRAPVASAIRAVQSSCNKWLQSLTRAVWMSAATYNLAQSCIQRVYPDISLPATSNDLHYTLSESHYYNQYHSLQQGNRSAACHQLLTRWENRLTPSLALKGKL